MWDVLKWWYSLLEGLYNLLQMTASHWSSAVIHAVAFIYMILITYWVFIFASYIIFLSDNEVHIWQIALIAHNDIGIITRQSRWVKCWLWEISYLSHNLKKFSAEMNWNQLGCLSFVWFPPSMEGRVFDYHYYYYYVFVLYSRNHGIIISWSQHKRSLGKIIWMVVIIDIIANQMTLRDLWQSLAASKPINNFSFLEMQLSKKSL